MGIYEAHKVITLTITSETTADKKFDWNEFIKELNTIIIENYNEYPLVQYKDDWKNAFRKVAKELESLVKEIKTFGEILLS